MEEVGTSAPKATVPATNKYKKLISATEMGQDFKDLEEMNQLQLNKKILKWTNVLDELKEMYKIVQFPLKERKFIKSPHHTMYDDYERNEKGEFIYYPVLNPDGSQKMGSRLNDKFAIRQYLDSIFHLKLKINKPLRDTVRGRYANYDEFNKDLFKEYIQMLKDNINRAVTIYNTREIELEKKQKEEAKAHQNKEIECGCGGHYSIRNKLKHFETKKHEKWAETQEPEEVIVTAQKADPKENAQNKEVECECGGKYTVRNKLKHFATGKHTKWLEAHK